MAVPSSTSPSTAPARVDILCVDDDARNLTSLEALLEPLGQNIVIARSGDEALRYLLERDFALILLDVRMPGMDGFEAASLVRARERSRFTPIIFLTGYQESDMRRAYSLGAVDFMTKPLVPEILRSKVAVFVDLAQRNEEIRRQAEMLRLAEQREHARRLDEERQRWEAESLRAQMEKERRAAEAIAQKADELARTVAELERLEAALRQTNERLGLLAETASRLLFEGDPEQILPQLLERFCQNLGLERYTIYLAEGTPPRLRLRSSLGLSPEEQGRFGVVQLGELPIGRAAEQRRPLTLQHVQGTIEPFLRVPRELGLQAIAVYPLLAGERLIGALGFESRRRSAIDDDELALMQMIADQAAIVLERARLMRELRERNDALADADRRKDEFLAMLAHELRNPLAPIVTGLKLLGEARSGPAAERARAAMERQAQHLTRLVDDLLDVSRITHGKIELRPERIDVRSIVQQAVDASRALVEQRGHTLEVVLPDDPTIQVTADPTRLTQIVANLLNNAAKYTPRGGRLHITCGRDHDGKGDCGVVTVRDNGIGIRPEMLPRVFDLFVQSDRSPDRTLGGLGIGLTLVKRLVELHGGEVTAHSEGLGKGSQFSVRLPLAAPSLAEVQASRAEADASEGDAAVGLRIVVVEDNADIRETLCDLLELVGHQVETAGDGLSGAEKIISSRPDVALVDIGMAGLDGYQVAQRVRARLGKSGVRLIAMTGYGRPEDRRRALASGFDEHLVKPVRPDHLHKVLRAHAPAPAVPELRPVPVENGATHDSNHDDSHESQGVAAAALGSSS